MAWESEFMTKIRKYWLRKVNKAQYFLSSTNSWYDGTITEKAIDGNTITIKFETTDEQNATITKVRLIDTDGTVAYSGTRSIVKDSSQGALLQIDVPLVEE
ncbi:MAG: hypothetical protein PHN80_06050 [Hespellia sp.]|nr:hypothetical protein [Hespellia sp.]